MPKRNSDWDDDDDDRPRRRSRRRDDDDDDDDDDDEARPRKRRRRRKPPSKSGTPFVLGLVGSGFVLLLVVAAVVVLSFMWKGGGPGGNAGGNNPLGLPLAGPPPVVRPPLPPGWVDFKHPECKMSIYCPQYPFPGEFTTDQPLGTPVADGKRNSKGYNSPSLGQKLWCYIGASDVAPSWPQSTRDFSLGESSFFQNPTTRDVMWGGRMAKEVSGELKVGVVASQKGTREVSRRFWVGNRFYKCDLTGIDGHPTAAEQAAFFDSFVLGE